MSRTYVVSGAASGIGAATTALLRAQGDTVVTVDLTGADVVADLATPTGRSAAVAGVRERAEVVDGVVPAAGVAGLTGTDPALVVSVNFFGAIALVEGLRDRLRGSVVLVASNSITGQPGWDGSVADACLAGDERLARERAAATEAVQVYPASKAALVWWARREGAAWAASGVRLNAVAPGKIATPMTERLAADPVLGPLAEGYPTALGRDGRAEEVAAVIAFLLADAASLLVGSVVYADGGTDAILHPRAPERWVL